MSNKAVPANAKPSAVLNFMEGKPGKTVVNALIPSTQPSKTRAATAMVNTAAMPDSFTNRARWVDACDELWAVASITLDILLVCLDLSVTGLQKLTRFIKSTKFYQSQQQVMRLRQPGTDAPRARAGSALLGVGNN
jgi:hypothetical protein